LRKLLSFLVPAEPFLFRLNTWTDRRQRPSSRGANARISRGTVAD
jgi:hypothetical protein